MYRYRLDSSFDKIPLEVNIIKSPLNKQGFADILSINLEYTHKLNRAKNRINDIDAIQWEEVKKLTNPYEFIHAFNSKNKGNDIRSVAIIKPLSRSFFKMIEMLHEFCPELIKRCSSINNVSSIRNDTLINNTSYDTHYNNSNSNNSNSNNSNSNNSNNSNSNLEIGADIIYKTDEKQKDKDKDKDKDKEQQTDIYDTINTVHIAEGPGGFIEAIRYVRINNINDNSFGMTLVKFDTKNDKNYKNYKNKHTHVPGWKQSNYFLINNPEVHIINGVDGTGDIYNPDNIDFLQSEMLRISSIKNAATLVTADGGFDYSIDYNFQEQSSSKLIFSQILGALLCQEQGGSFICKFFDINLLFTVEMIYLLYSMYETITIYKPFTSRIANSEKYIICNNFKGLDNPDMFKQQCDILKDVLRKWNAYEGETINYMFLKIPPQFIEHIKTINKYIIDLQIKSINTSIDIIKNKKYTVDKAWCDNNIEIQIKKAKEWCRKYNIPYRDI